MLKDTIRELRKRNGLTQKDLATKVNKTQQAVAKWEKGIAEPDMATIYNIASALNCSVMDLILPEFDADRIMIKDAIQTVAFVKLV